MKNNGEKAGFQNLKMNHINQQSTDVLLSGDEKMEDNYRYRYRRGEEKGRECVERERGRESWIEKEITDSVGGLNPNFEMAAFQSLHSELHVAELSEWRRKRQRSDEGTVVERETLD